MSCPGVRETLPASKKMYRPYCPMGMSFDSEIGNGFAKVDLCEEAVGCAEAIVDETTERIYALKVGAAKGWLKIEGYGTAAGSIGGCEHSSRSNGSDVASVAGVLHTKSVTPPRSFRLVEQRLAGRWLGKRFAEIE